MFNLTYTRPPPCGNTVKRVYAYRTEDFSHRYAYRTDGTRFVGVLTAHRYAYRTDTEPTGTPTVLRVYFFGAHQCSLSDNFSVVSLPRLPGIRGLPGNGLILSAG